MKEIIELRKEREKHYLNNDGTVTAYMYNEDIHYLENGEYKEIDNTLVEEDGYITNKANNFKIRLNKNKYLVKIELNEKEYLNISLRNANAVSAHILNNEVMYKEILSNIDIQYLVHGKTLKENIILKDKLNSNIVFNIETNLELVISDSKVLAKNGDNIIYVFNPLFMIDAKEQINNNCNYKLTKLENGYELEFILDEKYLIEAEYPIVIDPTVTTDNLENVEDITLYSSQPDHAAANTNYLSVGSDANGIMRTLLKFDLPKIATGNNIIKATAYLKHFGSYINENPKTIGVYEVTTNWSESTATWNNMNNNYNPKMETYLTPPQMVDTNSSFDIDLTNIVKRWYSDKENKGIMLKCLDESYDSTMPYYSFYSKTYDYLNSTTYRPLLTIEYRLQNGLLDYMTYENVSFSIGNSYVNNCTGNFSNVVSLSEILDSTCLFEMSLTYNTHDVILNKNNKFGLGFNISYNDTIEETINKYMEKEYKYTCSDGTSHYFYKYIKEDGTDSGEYHDEDGFSLTLEIKNETTKEFILKDKNNNVYNFTNGFLSKIEYADKTYVNITRDFENKITSIKDSKNNEATISYYENKVIFANGNKNITINISNNKLTSIVCKNGNLSFEYNSNSLISKIIDTNGLSMGVDYYNIEPYKVSKITEYGLNNEEGKSKSFVYEFNSTTVTDNQDIKMRYTFNNLGNTISTVLISDDNSLKKSYGFSSTYVNELKTPITNKPLASTLPIKYGENLIKNGSFETDEKNFFTNFRSSEDSFSGSYSVKIESYGCAELDRILEKDKTYTFSAYFKNNDIIDIQVYGTRATGQDIIYEETIMPNSEFTKCDFTFDVTYGYSCVGFTIDVRNDGIAYIDDVVINEGDVANNCNLIDNSNFVKGIDGWNVSGSIDGSDDIVANPYEIITLPSNEKAIQLNSIVNGSVSLLKTLNISGKKGDTFTFSFWYKNEGVLDTSYNMVGNLVSLTFFDSNSEFGECINNVILNYHADNWQFHTETCIAENDFDSIDIRVFSIYETNHLLLTNFSLTRDLGSFFYEYDENGNLISTIYPDNSKIKMAYDKNNQLLGVFDVKGNNYSYEYDNIKTDRLLKGISPTGISNEIKYDSFGNPVRTIINNVNPNGNEISGDYYIRSKGTDKYITPNLKTGELSLKNDTCSHYSFSIVNHNETETNTKVYNFTSSILPNYKLTKLEDKAILQKDSTGTYFELIQKNNGSYNIKVYKEDLYLKVNEGRISLANLKDTSDFEFYFETTNSDEFIENRAEYTVDGKHITKIIDSLGKETTYSINNDTGLIDYTVYPNNEKYIYEYNDKDELIRLSKDEKNINYTYSNQLLKSVTSGNKTVTFNYDNFLNPSEIKINNKLLVKDNYQFDKLTSKNYGNGSSIKYYYDELNRISKVEKEDRVFTYKYNNLGTLDSIIDHSTSGYNYSLKFNYDFANRLSNIKCKNMRIEYVYDTFGNIIQEKNALNNTTHNLEYSFNQNNILTKIKIDDDAINYNYDNLERLTSVNINNNIKTEYTYKKMGKKLSTVINTIKKGEDLYQYFYDELYNIIKVTKNGNTSKEYVYDTNNQLLTENNHDLNMKFIYNYDSEGNITSKKIFNLEDNTLIKEDTYAYSNVEWEDQLTSFNNENICYDDIGNPISIGNKTLNWENGKELKSYCDDINTFEYSYNVAGFRTNKKINNKLIEYYLDDDKVLFEYSDDYVLYFMYDDNDNLIGFKKNDQTYYYNKNYQNDIIGIYDNNYNEVVKYNYDSWGKLVSILDANNKEIIDKNNIGMINPFRYRSYYYDQETGLYYLNSRYYNPEWGRFINSDKIAFSSNGLFGINYYLYANNNPINYIDSNGDFPFAIPVLGAAEIAAGFVLAATLIYATAKAIQSVGPISIDLDLNVSTPPKKEKKSKKKNDKDGKNCYIYGLYNGTKIEYVGRTYDLKVREAQHKRTIRKDLEMHKIHTTTSYEDCRAYEQYYIEKYKTLNRVIKKSERINNQRNGVAIDSPFYRDYVRPLKTVYGETYVG